MAAVFAFYGLTRYFRLGLIGSRKLFHVLTLPLFLPGFIFSVSFLRCDNSSRN